MREVGRDGDGEAEQGRAGLSHLCSIHHSTPCSSGSIYNGHFLASRWLLLPQEPTFLIFIFVLFYYFLSFYFYE